MQQHSLSRLFQNYHLDLSFMDSFTIIHKYFHWTLSTMFLKCFSSISVLFCCFFIVYVITYHMWNLDMVLIICVFTSNFENATINILLMWFLFLLLLLLASITTTKYWVSVCYSQGQGSFYDISVFLNFFPTQIQ